MKRAHLIRQVIWYILTNKLTVLVPYRTLWSVNCAFLPVSIKLLLTSAPVRVILRQIRIRILGSVHRRTDPDPALLSVAFKMPTKPVGTNYISLKRYKVVKKSLKWQNSGYEVFSQFFCFLMERYGPGDGSGSRFGSGSVQIFTNTDSSPEGTKT